MNLTHVRFPKHHLLAALALLLLTLSSQAGAQAIFTVTSGGNSGAGTLRAAIDAANANATATPTDPSFILFDGVSTVTLTAPLPTITRPTFINVSLFGGLNPIVTVRATSLVSGSAITLGLGAEGSYLQRISVSCSSPQPCFSQHGINYDRGSNDQSTTETYLDNVVVNAVGSHGVRVNNARLSIADSRFTNNGGNGVHCLSGAMDFNAIRARLILTGSLVGLSANGSAAGNGGSGVHLERCGASRIGGPGDEGNTIGSNTGDGVHILRTPNVVVRNNLIGLGPTGLTVRANGGVGLDMRRTASLEVRDNTIANSGTHNVRLARTELTENLSGLVINNRIGTRLDGSPPPAGTPLTTTGISVSANDAPTVTLQQNTIAYHSGSGVTFGNTTINAIERFGRAALVRNSIHTNGNGIGGNSDNLAPRPVDLALAGNSIITGRVPSTDINGRVEFFVDDYDQGRLYVGQIDTFTLQAGHIHFTTAINLAAHHGKRLTAIYSDNSGWSSGFSTPINIGTHLLSTTRQLAQASERIASTDGSIDCPGFCTANYNSGSVILQTFPATGRRARWGGDCAAQGFSQSCVLNMNAARSASANFGPIEPHSLQVQGAGFTGSPTGGGNIVVSGGPPCTSLPCTLAVDHGEAMSFQAIPDEFSVSRGFSGLCITPASTCATAINSSGSVLGHFERVLSQVTVDRLGNGLGTITSSPAGIQCGFDCGSQSATFANDSQVLLHAAPQPNSAFIGWDGECSHAGSNLQCALEVNGFHTVSANFARTHYHLSLQNSGEGRVVSVAPMPPVIDCGNTCQTTLAVGSTIRLEAQPVPGWNLERWHGPELSHCPVADQTCTFTLNADVTLTPTFVAMPQYLGVNLQGQGRVTSLPAGIDCPGDCEENVVTGTLVELLPEPAAGWVFDRWESACTGSGTCSLSIAPGINTVTAVFVELPPDTQALTVTRVGQGLVVSNPAGINCGTTCSAQYASGTSVGLSATAADGWQFTGWSGACIGTGACQLNMSENRSVQASFEQEQAPPPGVVIHANGFEPD